jgi:hypothetical protein
MFTKTAILAAGFASLAAAAPVAETPSSSGFVYTVSSNASCPVANSADNVPNFLQDPALCTASYNAGMNAPQGYSTAFAGANGSTQALYGYMGYEQVTTYNTSYCAAQCNAKAGCASFNIYFERDPSVDPTDDCQNPASVRVAKCAYYSSIIDVSTATNQGQWRENFQVAITGSNGYVKQSAFSASGYKPANGTAPTSGTGFVGHIPTDKAINAPIDCRGNDSYAGVEWWNDGLFSVQRCADSCSRHSAWVQAQGGVMCNFFTTYLIRDSVANTIQQQCAMYSEEVPMVYAKNGGNNEGSQKVFNSYAFTASGYIGNKVCANGKIF